MWPTEQFEFEAPVLRRIMLHPARRRTNEPACLNGGRCIGVPGHVVSTTGGNGNNENCQFPFVYQNMSYAKCVETNEVR